MFKEYKTVWWLRPVILMPVVVLAAIILAWSSSAEAYDHYWHATKFIGGRQVILACAGVFAFLLGLLFEIIVPIRKGTMLRAAPFETSLGYNVFKVTAWVAIIAYIIWVGYAVIKGLRPGNLVAALTSSGASTYDTVQELPTIPGVTTATQCYFIPFALAPWLARVVGWKRLRRELIILAIFTLFRAFFRTERLAIYEISVVFAVSWVSASSRRWSPKVWRLRNLMPVIGLVLMVVSFGLSEFFRSWKAAYRDETNQEYSGFVLDRVAGYYAAGLNNGAMFYSISGPLPFPFASLDWFWRFPVLRDHINYYSAFNVPPNVFGTVLASEGNEELTNFSGVYGIYIDFGTPLGLLVYFLSGVVVGRIFRKFENGEFLGLMLYPIVVVGILDFPRTMYLTSVRVFPGYVAIAVVLFVIRKKLPLSGNSTHRVGES